MKWLREKALRELWMDSEVRDLNDKEAGKFADLQEDFPMLTDALRAESMTMNLLREDALEPRLGDDFNRRVLRKFRVENERSQIRYWMPAICGAAVTILALLTVLQLIQPKGIQTWQQPRSEARNTVANPIVFPAYDQLKNR